MRIERLEVPEGFQWSLNTERFYLPDYNRWIDINLTIFLSMRVCLTAEGVEEAYDLNWCLGERFDLKDKIFEVFDMALANDIELPFCSRIKPLYNDPDFLNAIEKRTNIKII